MSTEYPPLINEIVQKLDARQPLPPLAPETEWDSELTKRIQATSTADLFDGRALKDSSLADAVKSALLLWNDALDDSHDISQGVRSKTGSYWHGIMHRREPDYSNSKYWFARVGSHPIFPALRVRVLKSSRLIQANRRSLPATRRQSSRTTTGTRRNSSTGAKTPPGMPMTRSSSSCKPCKSRRLNSFWNTPAGMRWHENERI